MEMSKSVEMGGGREAAGRAGEGSAREKDVPNTVSVERYLASSVCPILRTRAHEIPVRSTYPVSGTVYLCPSVYSYSNKCMRIICEM